MDLSATSLKSDRLLADLNILHQNLKTTAECIKFAVELGFDCLAVNTELSIDDEFPNSQSTTEDGIKTSGKKRPKKKIQEIPSPISVAEFRVDQSQLNAAGKKLRLFTRLTLCMDDTSLVHSVLSNPAIAHYDILSIRPKTEEMFNVLVKKTEIDMIAVDLTEKCSWVSKKNLLQMAVENGIAFELTYARALSDSSTRRDVLTNARDIVRSTKGKGVIISSRAERPIELRAPYDVANMAHLFGLSAEQGMRAVSANCERLLLHAQSKKTLKGVISVQQCSTIADSRALQALLKVPEFRAECKTVTTGIDPISDKSGSSSQEEQPKKKKRKR